MWKKFCSSAQRKWGTHSCHPRSLTSWVTRTKSLTCPAVPWFLCCGLQKEGTDGRWAGISESHSASLRTLKGFSVAPALSGSYLGTSSLPGLCLSDFGISQVEGKTKSIYRKPGYSRVHLITSHSFYHGRKNGTCAAHRQENQHLTHGEALLIRCRWRNAVLLVSHVSRAVVSVDTPCTLNPALRTILLSTHELTVNGALAFCPLTPKWVSLWICFPIAWLLCSSGPNSCKPPGEETRHLLTGIGTALERQWCNQSCVFGE